MSAPRNIGLESDSVAAGWPLPVKATQCVHGRPIEPDCADCHREIYRKRRTRKVQEETK